MLIVATLFKKIKKYAILLWRKSSLLKSPFLSNSVLLFKWSMIRLLLNKHSLKLQKILKIYVKIYTHFQWGKLLILAFLPPRPIIYIFFTFLSLKSFSKTMKTYFKSPSLWFYYIRFRCNNYLKMPKYICFYGLQKRIH